MSELDELRARLCDLGRGEGERADALQALRERWPEALATLLRDGRLPRRALPTTAEWDEAGAQRGRALLLAASLDPVDVHALLADRSRPSAGEVPEGAPEPEDPWAVDVVAEVAPRVAELWGVEWAARFERPIRRRILGLSARPRRKPDSLFFGHAQLCEQLDAARALDGSLEVIEARLRLGVWKASRVGDYLRLWHRRWNSGRGLALILTRRVQDPLETPVTRLTARQALQELHLSNQTHGGLQDLSSFLIAADNALVRELRAARGDEELKLLIARELDRWVPAERVAALRAEGLLAPKGIPHLLELPGAPSDTARLDAALDDLARRVRLDELVETVGLAPELESAEELARLLTAIRLVPRVAARAPELAATTLGPLLEDLLDDGRQVMFKPGAQAAGAWTIGEEAKGALEHL